MPRYIDEVDKGIDIKVKINRSRGRREELETQMIQDTSKYSLVCEQ